LSNHTDLNSRLFDLIFYAVSGEVSCFAATETCFVVVTLLAFFSRESVRSLPADLSVFGLFLYLAGYDSVAILVVLVALLLRVGYYRLEPSL
jgi:hypothetical protein